MKLKKLTHLEIDKSILSQIFGGQTKKKTKKKKSKTSNEVSSDSTDTVKNDVFK